jgi:hypothetical protein
MTDVLVTGANGIGPHLVEESGPCNRHAPGQLGWIA